MVFVVISICRRRHRRGDSHPPQRHHRRQRIMRHDHRHRRHRHRRHGQPHRRDRHRHSQNQWAPSASPSVAVAFIIIASIVAVVIIAIPLAAIAIAIAFVLHRRHRRDHRQSIVLITSHRRDDARPSCCSSSCSSFSSCFSWSSPLPPSLVVTISLAAFSAQCAACPWRPPRVRRVSGHGEEEARCLWRARRRLF